MMMSRGSNFLHHLVREDPFVAKGDLMDGIDKFSLHQLDDFHDFFDHFNR